MDATRELRDPAGVALAAGLAVLAFRVGTGVYLAQRARSGTKAWYHPLTPAQGRVAELIAEGLTSKQIAERLFVEEGTVSKHIENINRELGFHRRSQIAAWVEKQRMKQVPPKS